MTFSFAKCVNCDRLNICGATCICEPERESRCDCTHDGNTQHVGPACQQRIKDAWADCINRSHAAAERIRATRARPIL